MWTYASPVGLMSIWLNDNNRYSLKINDEVYGFYHSAAAAADDVRVFETGCFEWDSSEAKCCNVVPAHINEWKKH